MPNTRARVMLVAAAIAVTIAIGCLYAYKNDESRLFDLDRPHRDAYDYYTASPLRLKAKIKYLGMDTYPFYPLLHNAEPNDQQDVLLYLSSDPEFTGSAFGKGGAINVAVRRGLDLVADAMIKSGYPIDRLTGTIYYLYQEKRGNWEATMRVIGKHKVQLDQGEIAEIIQSESASRISEFRATIERNNNEALLLHYKLNPGSALPTEVRELEIKVEAGKR